MRKTQRRTLRSMCQCERRQIPQSRREAPALKGASRHTTRWSPHPTAPPRKNLGSTGCSGRPAKLRAIVAMRDVDWVKSQKRRKYRWAGHVAQMADGRWAVRLLTWVPQGQSRRQARPNLRQSFSLDNFYAILGSGGWIEVVQDLKLWKEHEDAFIESGT